MDLFIKRGKWNDAKENETVIVNLWLGARLDFRVCLDLAQFLKGCVMMVWRTMVSKDDVINRQTSEK